MIVDEMKLYLQIINIYFVVFRISHMIVDEMKLCFISCCEIHVQKKSVYS